MGLSIFDKPFSIFGGAVHIDANITLEAASDIILQADTAAALEITDGTIAYHAIDTRTTTDSINANTFDVANPTIASASDAVFTHSRFAGFTLTYTGTTQVTSLVEINKFENSTISGAGGIVDKATTLSVKPPIEGSNITITDISGIRIIDPGGGTPTNQYGIYIEDLTAGGSDYGIYIEGADTYAIYVAADGIYAGGILEVHNGDADDYITMSVVSNVPTIYGTGAYLRIGDASTTAHSLASEDDLMVSGKLEVGGVAYFDANITLGAALDITLQSNTAAALEITDGTLPYFTIDTRTTTAGIVGNTLDVSNPTIASASDAVFTHTRIRGFSLTYTGITQVTSLVEMLRCESSAINAGTTIIDKATTISVKPVNEGSGTLTATSAIRIIDPGTGTPTNQYGIYIEDLTAGGSDYGIYIEGADTAAIVVASADPIQLGVAGSTTGTMNIQGATSGVVTLTVAAAAGTWTMTLPADNGDAGEQLQTDGAGVTSWEAAGSLSVFKNIHSELVPRDALDAILGTRPMLFNYLRETLEGDRAITTGDFETEYAGVLGEDAPWVMHHQGKIFSPVSAFGYTVAAIKAMEAEIVELREVIAEMKGGMAQ